MQPEFSAAGELTRRLLAQARGSDRSSDDAIAARHACEFVSTEFSRWVGARGYDALISRALATSRAAHPALELIRYERHPVPGLIGVAESIERHGDDVTARALAALLASVLALCIRLIGEDIVTTLVEKSLADYPHHAVGRAADADKRSARP